ncbi:hypothetical protein AC579_8103 [Pseudocercospora musae]|uniref:Uncharacterized protein n=1 Tax=Pseudocercospora musae TaxID=113226 RepID=A0A139IG96_9PEZI|nr:hypothetical protein AC579_8103 [Pseudocercospora musae]
MRGFIAVHNKTKALRKKNLPELSLQSIYPAEYVLPPLEDCLARNDLMVRFGFQTPSATKAKAIDTLFAPRVPSIELCVWQPSLSIKVAAQSPTTQYVLLLCVCSYDLSHQSLARSE